MFLDKNRDILHPDLIELLNSSTSPVRSLSYSFLVAVHVIVCLQFISSLFAEDYEISMSSGARKKKTPTVAAKFHQSLAELIGAMQQCHPFFVRCIKPNASKVYFLSPSLSLDVDAFNVFRLPWYLKTNLFWISCDILACWRRFALEELAFLCV